MNSRRFGLQRFWTCIGCEFAKRRKARAFNGGLMGFKESFSVSRIGVGGVRRG